MTKLQTAVVGLAKSGHNTVDALKQAGWTQREIESAVNRGELKWLADGRVAAVV